MRRQLVAEAFVLLATVSTFCLGDTTYSIVNYGQDGVSIGGTITTSINDGPLTAGDITGFNIVITPPSEPSLTLTPSASVYVLCNFLTADPSSLYLPPGQGGYFHLFSDSGWVVNLDYEDYYAHRTAILTEMDCGSTTYRGTSCSV